MNRNDPVRPIFPSSSLAVFFAHDGHGTTDSSSSLHWLLEPSHTLTILLAAILVFGAIVFVRRRHAASDKTCS